MKKNNTTTTAPETFTINNKTYYGTYDKAMDKYMERHESEKGMTFTQWYDDFIVPTTANEGKQDKGNGHTPGEWLIAKSYNSETRKVWHTKDLVNGEGKVVAKGIGDTALEAEANAKLIASAPQLKSENEKKDETIRELLEALKKSDAFITDCRNILLGDRTYSLPPYTEKYSRIKELDAIQEKNKSAIAKHNQ